MFSMNVKNWLQQDWFDGILDDYNMNARLALVHYLAMPYLKASQKWHKHFPEDKLPGWKHPDECSSRTTAEDLAGVEDMEPSVVFCTVMAQVYMSGRPMPSRWAIVKVTEQFVTQICETNDWHRELQLALEYWDMEWKMPLGWHEENNMPFYRWNKCSKVKTGSHEYETYGASLMCQILSKPCKFGCTQNDLPLTMAICHDPQRLYLLAAVTFEQHISYTYPLTLPTPLNFLASLVTLHRTFENNLPKDHHSDVVPNGYCYHLFLKVTVVYELAFLWQKSEFPFEMQDGKKKELKKLTSDTPEPVQDMNPEASCTMVENYSSFNHYTTTALTISHHSWVHHMYVEINAVTFQLRSHRSMSSNKRRCIFPLPGILIENEEDISKVSVVHTYIDYSQPRHCTQYFTQSLKPKIPQVAQVSSSSDTSLHSFLLDNLQFGIYEQQEQMHSDSALVTYVLDQHNDVEDHPDLPTSTAEPAETVSPSLRNELALWLPFRDMSGESCSKIGVSLRD
ncbi:hypothetical protein GYMLUDRAFT_59371 [Collybiopsis luxurians FD-317 M1]|uniref:Uncharacterized protein n=1 Tax=Collybiopsis luxurians FD-317 M1 TaxID=944289 RepID=A0A0D0CDR0_9AGAR|nr:hypothetical protein GYMLUDRAFT_59371 [Collybiopsis luxurians FD-317 M1]